MESLGASAWLVLSFLLDNLSSLLSLTCLGQPNSMMFLILVFFPIRASPMASVVCLLCDICSRPILSWPPSLSKCTEGRKTFNAIVCIDHWSPFNTTRHHRSTLAYRSCRLPRQYFAPQFGNEGGNKTQAVMKSILRLQSHGDMGWNGGGNHLQWRHGCILCKDGFIHWLHVIVGVSLFNSSSMGCFNNDIALRQGRC